MFTYIPELLKGLSTSLILTASALLLALLLSTIFTVFLTLKTRVVSTLIRFYIVLFTGTPLLIQIFLIYYGPGQFSAALEPFPVIWEIVSNPWVCAITALALNSAAYTTVLLHGAVKAIPEGQWQACAALGMNRWQTLAIVYPYAFKRALSAYSNEVILVLKGSSLVYTITLMDVMGYASKLVGETYDVMALVNAGIIYLCINTILTLVMRSIEKKALAFEKTA